MHNPPQYIEQDGHTYRAQIVPELVSDGTGENIQDDGIVGYEQIDDQVANQLDRLAALRDTAEQDALDVDDNPFWQAIDAARFDADRFEDERMAQAIEDLADQFDIDRAF